MKPAAPLEVLCDIYIKTRYEFLENAANLLKISFKEAGEMSIGELTTRLEVMQELRRKDNERYKKTGEIGAFSDIARDEDRFLRDLKESGGYDPKYAGDRYRGKKYNIYDNKTDKNRVGQWEHHYRVQNGSIPKPPQEDKK